MMHIQATRFSHPDPAVQAVFWLGGGVPGDPQEPGEPFQPTEPGEPTVPDQPPPAPVA